MNKRPHFEYIARVTWVILALDFILLLGGFHPAKPTRNFVLFYSSVLIILLNLPVAYLIVKGIICKWENNTRYIVALLIRGLISYLIIKFISGI